ncbi:DUF2514 domain-containing protein [Pseudomonas massiliensis]|uniref:DUF2514 domain-containing protein n=1 Tax=Pseudomonas massiliensis TaxID=522492 RepID=UPI00058EC939|nr:DUF2514 domain-containing protein [Pseudomonas massiliensis]
MTALQWKLLGYAGAVLLAVLACGGALYGAYRHGETTADLRWQAKAADQQALQAKARAAAEGNARTEEQRRQTAANEVGNDARRESAALAADVAGADGAGQRVRDAADAFAAGASCRPSDPGIARRGEAATRAAMVLSELFKRADQRAGELAAAYDRARIAGLACERTYDALTNKQGKRNGITK